MKLYFITVATAIALGFILPANAQEVAATDPAIVETPAPVAASPMLQEAFNAICESDAKLSDKARLACINSTLPKVAKTGDIFRNVGIGAEFNTLIRNSAAFTVATSN